VIQQKTGKGSNIIKSANSDSNSDSKVSSVAIEYQQDKEPSLYKLKKAVLKPDSCCQFKNKDGRVCGSRWNLQVDHIQPKWAGGKDIHDNLRVLCGNHNRHIYRKQANIRTL